MHTTNFRRAKRSLLLGLAAVALSLGAQAQSLVELYDSARNYDATYLSSRLQFQAAQSIPIAAANQGGMAGLAAGIGAGVGLGGIVSDAMRGAMGTPTPATPNSAAVGAGAAAGTAAGAAAGDAPSGETKFCMNCGAKLPAAAKFCSSCGAPQG